MRLFPRLLPAGSLFASQRVCNSKTIEITIESDSKMSLGPGEREGEGRSGYFNRFARALENFVQNESLLYLRHGILWNFRQYLQGAQPLSLFYLIYLFQS